LVLFLAAARRFFMLPQFLFFFFRPLLILDFSLLADYFLISEFLFFVTVHFPCIADAELL